jgi:hypothetical protein
MLGLRVTPAMKAKLDAAAAQSGRSQSQEAEIRLERSFDADETEALVRAVIAEELAQFFDDTSP